MSNTNYRNVTFLVILLLVLTFTCFYVVVLKSDEDVPVYTSLFQKED